MVVERHSNHLIYNKNDDRDKVKTGRFHSSIIPPPNTTSPR